VAKLSAISWQSLVRRLKKFGFEGPYQGGRHPYMLNGDLVLALPNPHRKEIGVELLTRILKQAGISRDQWVRGS